MGHSLVVVAEADFFCSVMAAIERSQRSTMVTKSRKKIFLVSKMGYISVSFNKEVGVYGESQK